MVATRYARAGDLHIAYQVFGDGPVDLVVVWGTLSEVEVMWEEPGMARLLERLSSFARVVHFDKRGMGLSDRVEGTPTLEERMDDVRAVMDAIGSERAYLLGESEGAPMSLLFAATYPERTLGLILYGALVKVLATEDFPWGVSAGDFERFLDWMVSRWGTGQAAVIFGAGMVAATDWLASFERRAASPGAIRELMIANLDIDIRPVLASVAVPTLVIHRTDDLMVPVGQGRYLADVVPGARYVEQPEGGHFIGGGDIDALAAEIQEHITGTRPLPQSDRVLATVLFTDIVGSTEQVAAVGDEAWSGMLRHHDHVLGVEVARFGGRLVKSTGDGILATFDGPARAVRCAQAILAGLAGTGIAARAGLHTGEIELRGDDIAGIAVHIAKRVEAAADPGTAMVSRTVKDLVAGSGIIFEDRGVHALKGIEDDWQLYAAVS